MPFTYTPSVPNDITRVRFHLGDTDVDAPIFDDSEITFMISEMGSWQQAVIACIQSIIGRISAEPDFQADWLSVDASSALNGYKTLLSEKRNQLGIPSLRSRGQAVYRGDSDQTSAPDW